MSESSVKRTPTPRRGLAASRGFSLAEALAALVLMAVVLPVALRAISRSLAMGSDTVHRAEATLLAQSKLSELVATGGWEESALAGDFTQTASGEDRTPTTDTRGVTYTWSATVEDWLDQTVKELTVRVAWESHTQEHEVTLATLVYTEEE